ncbi:MAG TPA: sodium/proton-translocating pyrophosphatase, partial [Caldisericia bacterium]|nr:sodium/proton-translocating pyrophosphatase [Caldisericia bacterium]
MELLVLGIGLLGLLVAALLVFLVRKSDPGDSVMVGISNAIRQGAFAFLTKEYQYMLLVAIPFAILIGFVISPYVTLSFSVGALFSVLAGFVGMNVATLANTRTTQAAKTRGEGRALDMAFSGGAVMGLVVSSLGIIGITALFLVFRNTLHSSETASILVGFSVGAS